jgi:prepilin-type N-terminal cleavage/methylation domain-containing protein
MGTRAGGKKTTDHGPWTKKGKSMLVHGPWSMVRPSSSVRPSGFTLVEMIVLIFIIAILSSVAVPAYHRFKAKSVFQATVERTVSLLTWARAAAVESNSDAVLQFDHQSGTFIVSVPPRAPSEDMPAALQEAERLVQPPQPRTSVLGEDVAVAEFSVNRVNPNTNTPSGIQEIRFHEDGSSDGARIALVSADGYRAFLHVLPMTGRTVVSDEPE